MSLKYFRMTKVLLSLSLIFVILGCSRQQDEEEENSSFSSDQIVQTNEPTATPETKPILIDFPSGSAMISDLFPDNITKIELECSSMSGKYIVSIENEAMKHQILDGIGSTEIVDDYEPIFGAGGKNVKLSIYDGETMVISLEEDSSYVTLAVEHGGKKKDYAVADESLREETVIISVFDAYVRPHNLALNNGKYDIEFIPLLVECDGYTISGEVGTYAWPAYQFETIDFADYVISIDGEVITELPTESGEYILVVDNGIGLYQLKFFVGE